MSNVRVCRKLDMDQQECREVAEGLLERLVEKMGGSYSPDGENYIYKHTTGVKAMVEPKEGELNIDVKLSLMTRAFGPRLSEEINKQLDKHLT
ncbi:MAG: polyhydroxyalkanoic acid system family protein [Pseudomonadota bacterium]